MNRSKYINKRTNSITKPILYLILQITVAYEVMGLLNGSFNIFLWSRPEQIIVFLICIYFMTKTFKIIHRSKNMDNEWHHKIEMEKFMNR